MVSSGEKMGKFLDVVKPFVGFVPEVKQPTKIVAFKNKVLWTGMTLLLFLLYSRIPLWGITKAKGSDPLYWLRSIMASNRGTLMELGISPIITSGMIMQLLAGTKIIAVDNSVKSERMLFNGAQKLFGLVFTIVQAVAYVISGMYGSVKELGFFTAFLIILQLSVAGLVVTILDEFLQKGYGIGSGISLFTATNICENIIWQCFSPSTYNFGRGTEFEGCIIALIHLLITRGDKGRALQEAFTREHLPNVGQLLATVIVFLMVVYFQGVRVELSLKHKTMRNYQGSYPVKLFYTSNTPIILQSALTSLVYFISQMLFKSFPRFFLIKMIGEWSVPEAGDRQSKARPIGGLVYFISPPHEFKELLHDPLHGIIYLAFTLTASAVFSRIWVDVSGQGVKDVAQQMQQQQVFFPGFREQSSAKELQRYIPIAASFGGMCIGLLSVSADFLGAIGSGTGILLAVTTIYQYFETFVKEGSETGLF
ncbi:MAG: putative Protein transport protein Sec61 subunit alpha [Streblomastix strix]|uniref:Translocon Sec61/SecY plug domain-containing protein n=1 Tax=Streblomastix strix TaxID=222440 RepID=A0A5J4W3G4_9EUKA|nr:MAG: putative Protein transport protein Sec61 subunit alpha [Streblomastix strix]